jgi:hypothetical protein
MRVATTANGLASASYVTLGTANSGTTFTNTKANLDALGLGTGTSRYVQVKATLAPTSGTNPQLDAFTIYYLSDNSPPESMSRMLCLKHQVVHLSHRVAGPMAHLHIFLGLPV